MCEYLVKPTLGWRTKLQLQLWEPFGIMSRKLQEWPLSYTKHTKGPLPMGKTEYKADIHMCEAFTLTPIYISTSYYRKKIAIVLNKLVSLHNSV